MATSSSRLRPLMRKVGGGVEVDAGELLVDEVERFTAPP